MEELGVEFADAETFESQGRQKTAGGRSRGNLQYRLQVSEALKQSGQRRPGLTGVRGDSSRRWKSGRRCATADSITPRSTTAGPLSSSPNASSTLRLRPTASAPSASSISRSSSAACRLRAHASICCSTKSELFFRMRSIKTASDESNEDVRSSAGESRSAVSDGGIASCAAASNPDAAVLGVA